MGKDKDKHKSKKTKDANTHKSGKDKKSAKEKSKAVEKKSAKAKPKSNKSKVVSSKSPKNKDKSAKTSPKSKVQDKSSGKKSAQANSNKAKPPPKGTVAKPNTKTKTHAKPPKSEIQKSKCKSEKSQNDVLDSVISSNASANSNEENQVVKMLKKEKPTLVKKPPVKPKTKVNVSKVTESDKESSYKAALTKKTVPKKVKQIVDIKEAIKKACKIHVKSAKKKSPLKKNKEKMPAPPPPSSTTKKAIVKAVPAKVLSESSLESVQKAASKAPEESGKLEKSASVDLPASSATEPAESVEGKSSSQQTAEAEKAKEEKATTTAEEEEEEEQSGEAEAEQAVSLPLPPPPPTESVEFTKPTVNQPKGRKEASPMCYSAEIGTNEFEALFDEIAELNSGATTLKHSYGSIVTSLVHMHNRRQAKNKMGKEGQKSSKQQPPQQFTFMNTRSEVSAETALQMEECLEGVEKYDMERFINPITREKTFKMLFDEIEDLNKKTHKLRTEFFDDAANFLREKYDNQKAYKVERKRFNQLKLWTKKLLTVVDDISRTYNDDLLNMFRVDGV